MKPQFVLICVLLLVVCGGCCVWNRRAYERDLWNPDDTPAEREEYDDDLKPLESTER